MAVATARWLLLLLAVSAAVAAAAAAAAAGKQERWRMSGAIGGQVVEKERRTMVAEAEAGTVTAVDVADAAGTAYRLHFITMDPGALFLPVQLHADMVFYVHSGRGKVTFIEEGNSEQSSMEVERGDVYNLEQGSILYIQSYPNATRQRLRIYAIFTSEGINADDPWKPKVEAYSSISNLLKGFKTEVLRHGFGVQREVAEAIKSAKTPPLIIPYDPQEKGDEEKSNWTEDIVDALLGVRDPEEFLNKKDKHKSKDKKSKSKAFNFYSGKPDVHNCYGWSRTMTNKDLDALHGSNIGMFMVNLTTGSMMAPHWNPKATEIAIVTAGSGIVQTVCPSNKPSGEGKKGRRHHGDERRGSGGRSDDEDKGGARCRSSVLRVKEGDVFVVPRFHPMAQMSFNNDSFVFVGFSTHMGQNHPQFLAGKGSVLQAIGKEVLALSLGHTNSTAVEKLLSAQRDSTILSCISCAEELEEKAAKEEQRRREEEEEEEGEGKGPGEREEEERRREQKERERKEREEEERRREQKERERKEREEEERQRREEERARREEKQRQREEEERAREEEEERRREEEEGGGGRGDEPEREEEEEGGDEPPYRLSKKLKKRYQRVIRSG
ncbi:Vicilin-like seed storage protein [Dichanthelium oligosanthes]|uniref:Vicilin-like seed storage protein n=1 Tax=Dichanthelium oligosanthes TaxID=888268 RepID=A0A1E5UVU6_9POAL|nr:Vicilin-like seed storage protein [Dichanthelium oligosanthes]